MSFAVNEELLQGPDSRPEAQLPEGVFEAGQEIPPDRVLLFEVNGRQYTGPKKVDHRIVFRYLRAVRRDEDSSVAMANLLGDALGDAVLDALATEELSDEEFRQVMRVVEKHMMGSMEATLGNSSNGRRK